MTKLRQYQPLVKPNDNKRGLRVFSSLLLVVLTVPVLLFGAYFAHGSFEQFPTDEQQYKARIVSGLGIIFFVLLEAAAVIVFMRASKSVTSANYHRPIDSPKHKKIMHQASKEYQ